MLERNVDGLVVIPSRFRRSRLTRNLFGKTPVVTFDRPVSDPSLDVVLVQNSAGARRIVEHLIEHGHSTIAPSRPQPLAFFHQCPFPGLPAGHAGRGT